MKISKIDDKLTVYKNNSVIIWGASGAGKKMYKLLKAYGIEVAAFCDSDSLKWKTQCCNLDIYSPDELEKMYNEHCVIQIASVYEKEIEEELLQRGIKNYISYSEAELRLMNLKKYNISKEHPKVYHYYLNNKYYPANLREWETIMSPILDCKDEVVFLCMPPKTGDYTMMNTLSKYGIDYINLWHTADRFTNEMREVLGNKTIKVITATRDIISQNLSLMFETMDLTYWDTEEYWINGGDSNELFAKWLLDVGEWEKGIRKKQDCFHAYKTQFTYTSSIQSFFEKEFKQFFGVDVYEYTFDRTKGFSIIKKDNVEIFIYQIEKLNTIYKELFKFLNILDGKLLLGNCANKKWYFPYYRNALKNIKFSRDYYEACYNSQYLQHFYSNKDINKFKESWSGNILD